jgi:hypothetical protein
MEAPQPLLKPQEKNPINFLQSKSTVDFSFPHFRENLQETEN